MPNGQGNDQWNELLNRVKHQRCEASFKTLFTHYYPKILSYFQQGGIKDQKSSDLTQETLLVVWQKTLYFDPSKGNCSTWIFTIARNLRYDHFRAKARDILNIGSDDLYNQTEDPSLQVDEHILSNDIREQINSLPTEQKDAVHAMYFEGCSHGEYAKLKKIPLGTVKSRIRLALTQLKKGMEDQ